MDQQERADGERDKDAAERARDGVATGGKLSSEGTERPTNAPDAGSPGGMGGVGARGGTGTGRPPGGVSPLSSTDGSD